MLLTRTGVEIIYFILIVIMKFLPYVKNEFVPLYEPMRANEQPNDSSNKYSELASIMSKEGIYGSISSLNKTKDFLKTIRRDLKTTKLTTCTPFFIRRFNRTKQHSKEGYNFHDSSFTSNKMVENVTYETFKPHRGKIRKFFFHKTIDPKTEIDYSTGPNFVDTHTNNYTELNNIPTRAKQIKNEYDSYSNRYTIFKTISTMESNTMPTAENNANKYRVTCIANSKCRLTDTTVSCCADFTDRKKQSSTKLINVTPNIRNNKGTTLNGSHPQLFNKILGLNHKNSNYLHELKQFNNISDTFITMDETVSHTKGTSNFNIKDSYYAENKTLRFEASFSPYTKIRLKNVLNFKEPSKSKSWTKKYTPILFKQKNPNKYTQNQTISSNKQLVFTNGDDTNQHNCCYSRRVDETPTSKSVTRVPKHCADSEFQTPDSVHRGILIIPPPNFSHSESTNVNTAVDYHSTLSSKINGQNGNKIDGSENVSNKVNLNPPKGLVNKNINMQSNDVEPCRYDMETRSTPNSDVSSFNLKNIINFKKRTTKFSELSLVKKSRFYAARHPYIYGISTPNYFPRAEYKTLNRKLSHPNFTHLSAINRDEGRQTSEIKYVTSDRTKNACSLQMPLAGQTIANLYSTESVPSSNSESGNSLNIRTVVTDAARTKLNLFNFKKPTSMFTQLESADCTTETENNVTTSNKENDAVYYKETQSQSHLDKIVPSNFNYFKNLFGNKKHSNIMPEYYIGREPGNSELTEPISQYSNTSTEKIRPAYVEGSTKRGCSMNPPITPTITDTSCETNISYGFDPGGRDDMASRVQTFSQSIHPKIAYDKASNLSNSSAINYPKGVLKQNALKYNTAVNKNYLKVSNSIDQWIFRSSRTTTIFTYEPRRNNSQFYNNYVESEVGNMFRWHSKNSENYASPLESSSITNYAESSYTPYVERNVKTLPQAPKNRIKSMFNLKRPHKISNVTANYPIFGSSNSIVTSNLTFTTHQLSNVENTSEDIITKSKTQNFYSKTRGTYNQVKIYKPFEKVLDKKTFTIKMEEFHPNLFIKNTTNIGNNSAILHDDYTDYAHSHKQHRLEIINTGINNTSNNSDTSNGILEFVFKPFSFLVNEFKSNSSKQNVSNYLPDSITNISIPNPLNLNSSLVIIAAVNSTTNSSAEEVHDSKVGWLDMLGGWFHCVVESYSEPKPQDIHFYLYTRNWRDILQRGHFYVPTRNNSHDPEELLIPEQTLSDDNTTTEVPEPVFEQESSPEPAKKKKELDEDYNSFEPLNPAKSEIESKWFNVLSETKILIHGYVQDVHTNIMVNMKDAYLTKGAYNVIVVDWSVIGDNSCYPMVATRALHGVGTLLAHLLDRLVEGGVSLQSVHVVGFSLGAHVAGHAGTELRSGLVSRITGLDPALPYVPMESDVSLDAGDAVFVDMIHSAAGYLGQPGPMGHVDFYPNGGSQQPGCDISSLGTCSHRRSALYFIESITSETGFPGTSCDSWHAFQAGRCANNTSRLMGELCPADSSGKFYLTTGSREPFAQQVEEHAKVKKSLLLDLFYDENV